MSNGYIVTGLGGVGGDYITIYQLWNREGRWVTDSGTLTARIGGDDRSPVRMTKVQAYENLMSYYSGITEAAYADYVLAGGTQKFPLYKTDGTYIPPVQDVVVSEELQAKATMLKSESAIWANPDIYSQKLQETNSQIRQYNSGTVTAPATKLEQGKVSILPFEKPIVDTANHDDLVTIKNIPLSKKDDNIIMIILIPVIILIAVILLVKR